ncbi:hypothetical protein [Mycoplasmopsis cynos]|nr:hypothetical protein [Mycoplasmopsis cynos]WAM04450.1 hypothetical protein ONA01_05540 [Mycoplasmopsis cynos]
MVIDSRFNLVGINFAHVVESDDPQNKGNQIVLFKKESTNMTKMNFLVI